MGLHNLRMYVHHGVLLISGARHFTSVPRSVPHSCVPAFTVALRCAIIKDQYTIVCIQRTNQVKLLHDNRAEFYYGQ